MSNFIEDPDLFRAVSLAKWLIREQHVLAARAIYIAAKKYDFTTTEVAHHLGVASGQAKKARSKWRAYGRKRGWGP